MATLASPSDLEYVWNIEGHDNIMAKAIEMIDQAKSRAYLALVPTMCQELRPTLEKACERGVSVRLYTTSEVDVAGCRVVVAHVAEEILDQARGLGLILVIDGEEVLIGEWLAATRRGLPGPAVTRSSLSPNTTCEPTCISPRYWLCWETRR